MKENFIKLRGLNIFTRTIGDGEPLVFLHGGPGGEHRYFLPHLEELSKDFRLVFYDQRGCGRSEESTDKAYSIQEEIETLEELRTHLGIEKLNLVGESWGSMLALSYACAYPTHVNKLFLTAAVGAVLDGYLGFEQELLSRLSDKDKSDLEKVMERLRNEETTVEEVFSIIDPYYVFSVENLHKKSVTKANNEVNTIMGEDIKNLYDLSKESWKLEHIPIVVAQGENDIITPDKLQEVLVKYLPHTKLEIIKECGHWSVIEKPTVLMDIIKRYFSE